MPERDKIEYSTSLEALLINIVQQAQEDGRISVDESELINRIQIDAREFENELAKARTEEHGKDIHEIYLIARRRIIENATELAKKDGVITDDEKAILDSLVRGLDEFEKQSKI